MVEITKIECQKNKDKFNLFVDDQFYSGIMKETAIANNFFVGKKLDKDELDKILVESESKLTFSKASDLLATRLHSKNELRLKLLKRGYSSDAILLALEKLEEYGYINDREFALLFVQSNAKHSKQMLKNKLATKGVSAETIDDALSKVSADDELENAIKLAEKYLKNKNFEDNKNKLYVFLARKGFSNSVIKKAIYQVAHYDIDIN